MADGNVEVLQNSYEAFGRGDIPAVLEVLAEDVEWNVPSVLPHGMNVRGREEVGGFFEQIGSTWEDFGLEVEDWVASGDRVCVLGRVSGTLNGVKTGYGFVHAWTMRDGTPVKFDEYVDPQPELLG